MAARLLRCISLRVHVVAGAFLCLLAFGFADPAAAQNKKELLAQLKSQAGYCYELAGAGYGDPNAKSLQPDAFRRMIMTTKDRIEVSGARVTIISSRGTTVWVYVLCGQSQTFLSSRFAYATPGVSGVELGFTFGHTGSNQDARIDTTFGSSGAGSVMDSANTVGFDARVRVAMEGLRVAQDWGARQITEQLHRQASPVSLFAGYRFQSYTNEKGELVISFHPTPGNDTFLRYRPDSSHTFYGGIGFDLGVYAGGAPVSAWFPMVDLYAGYRHVTGDIIGSSNETGGGGGITPLGGGFNQSGLVIGGELNFRTNALGYPIIIGVGADVAFLKGGSISNHSVPPLGFTYTQLIDDRRETTIYGKVAIPFDPLSAIQRNVVP
jgi:hypothetical protein